MKQHITAEQINELSEKGKKALLTWWKPQWTDLIYNESQGAFQLIGQFAAKHAIDAKRQGNLPLLSIGQMIAFLGDQKVDSKNFKGNIPVSRLICDAEANHIVIAWNDTELSNALWQAVKEVLEKHDV